VLCCLDMFFFLTGRLVATRMCLLLCAAALVALGIATLYAIDHPAEASPGGRAEEASGRYQRQAVFAALGLGAFLAVNAVPYRVFGPHSGWVFASILCLLFYLAMARVAGAFGKDLPFAPLRNHVYQWITPQIGGRTLPSIQPSEFCKLAYILTLAWYLRYRSNYRSIHSLVGPFVLTLLPVVLILAEPDLGTVCLLGTMLYLMLFVAGARGKHLMMILLAGLMVSPFLWLQMNPKQRNRVSAVVLQNAWVRQKVEDSPSLSRVLAGGRFTTREWMQSYGYQLERSKNAIASGGGTGYGFRKGPFIKYDFLKYRESDFVFALIAHQWGFLGAVGVLLLYVLICVLGLEIAAHNTDPFGRLLAVGIVILFTVEVVVNVGVTVGLMPITGLTLPLVSHGGSSLMVHMIAIGLLNNVGRSRPFSLARPT